MKMQSASLTEVQWQPIGVLVKRFVNSRTNVPQLHIQCASIAFVGEFAKLTFLRCRGLDFAEFVCSCVQAPSSLFGKTMSQTAICLQ